MADARRDLRLWLSRRTLRTHAPPDWLSVNLTLRCNLSCAMCTTCYDAPELSAQEIKDLIDQAAEWGVRVFNPLGGEPFLRRDLEDILAHAATRDLHTTLTTNGTLILADRAARISAIPPEKLHINLSLDGPRPAHDAVRGAGMFDRTLAGYRRLRDADRAAGNPDRRVCANSILNRRNYQRFEPFLDHLEAEGFHGVQILNLFRNGTEQTASDLWFTPDDLPELEALCDRLARRGPFLLNRPEDLRLIPRYYRDGLRPLEAPCWAGWKELYVNADGAVLVCDGKLDFLNGRFGDVRRQTLRDLWDSPALRARRRTVRACTTPCIQNCYLRHDSDHLSEILPRLAAEALPPARARLDPLIDPLIAPIRDRLAPLIAPIRRLRPAAAPLTLELSDIPADPAHPRLLRLLRAAPIAPADLSASPDRYPRLRDTGALDTGRGFLGREIVARLLRALRSLHLPDLRIGGRGDPMLHPEFLLILGDLARAQQAGQIGRLSVACSGALLSPEIAAALAAHRRAHPLTVAVTDPAHRSRGAIFGAVPDAPPAQGWLISWDAKLAAADDLRLERAVSALEPPDRLAAALSTAPQDRPRLHQREP